MLKDFLPTRVKIQLDLNLASIILSEIDSGKF